MKFRCSLSCKLIRQVHVTKIWVVELCGILPSHRDGYFYNIKKGKRKEKSTEEWRDIFREVVEIYFQRGCFRSRGHWGGMWIVAIITKPIIHNIHYIFQHYLPQHWLTISILKGELLLSNALHILYSCGHFELKMTILMRPNVDSIQQIIFLH